MLTSALLTAVTTNNEVMVIQTNIYMPMKQHIVKSFKKPMSINKLLYKYYSKYTYHGGFIFEIATHAWPIAVTVWCEKYTSLLMCCKYIIYYIIYVPLNEYIRVQYDIWITILGLFTWYRVNENISLEYSFCRNSSLYNISRYFFSQKKCGTRL